MTEIGFRPQQNFINDLKINQDTKQPPIGVDGAGPAIHKLKEEQLKPTPSPFNFNDKNIMVDGGGKHYRENQNINKINEISKTLFPLTVKEMANEIIYDNNSSNQLKSLLGFQDKIENLDGKSLNELKEHLESLKGSFNGENKSGSLNRNELVDAMLTTVNREIKKDSILKPLSSGI